MLSKEYAKNSLENKYYVLVLLRDGLLLPLASVVGFVSDTLNSDYSNASMNILKNQIGGVDYTTDEYYKDLVVEPEWRFIIFHSAEELAVDIYYQNIINKGLLFLVQVSMRRPGANKTI